MTRRYGWLALAIGAVATGHLVAGCNMITGADGLTVGDADDDSAADGGPSGAGAGDVGQGAAGPTGSGQGAGEVGAGGDPGTGAGGPTGAGGDEPPIVGGAADGVTVTDLELYQPLRVPLMGSSDIPVVAGRDALVRVYYQTDGDYDGQPVTARFTAGNESVDTTATLGGSSSQNDLGSTVNIQVPGSLIVPGGTYRVDLLQPNGTGSPGAGYPPGTEQVAHGAQSTGAKLEVLLVPVQYGGQLPDTSPGQVQKYEDMLRWQYPIPEVEVTVRSQPYVFGGGLNSYNGWSQLLDAITQLRQTDNAPAHVYYYGIHMAQGSGLLGLGWVGGANDVWSRTAIGVGWSGDTAPETAVHEIGHNHGRSHSPCGVSGDPNYPHQGASIGVLAFHPGQSQLISPNQWVDFMSYCSPAWVSDYTFKALVNRMKIVNGAAIAFPPAMMNRTWDRIRVLDGQVTWLEPVTMGLPPVGESLAVSVQSDAGTTSVTGHYYAYDHLPGGLLYVPAPSGAQASPSAVAPATQLAFVAEGQAFVTSRP